jgi:hypothetical protein
MTIPFEFNNLRHGRACPGHPRPARILLIGWHSAFFRSLLSAAVRAAVLASSRHR